ncbi:hypothetical protein [Sphingomonas faeni]|uniref:hypothetical protein n=1 Tax=Sphingomonas faeni TaxID=185950 RepID=UPI0033618328
MLVLAMLAATIEVRRDGPPLTLEQARAMTPAALGDALLTSPHPPIVEAVVGPEGMVPPPPPDTPEATEIKLFAAAVPASQPGFCEKVRATITLAPVMRREGTLPPARAQAVSSTPLYRWAEPSAGPARCEAKRYAFFALDPGLGDRAFTVIRLLGTLKNAYDRKVQISIDDRGAREMRDYAKGHRDEMKDMPKDAITPIVSGRSAISKFPISSITAIRRYVDAWDRNPLTRTDLKAVKDHGWEAYQIFAGGEWDTGVIVDGDRIVTVRFVKAVPPPF